MKIKKFLIVFLICIFTFAEVPQATPSAGPIFLTDTYKQGIIDISKFTGYAAIAKLITPNKCLAVLIINSSYNVKFYKRFNDINEETAIGVIEKGDIAVIVGSGELIVSHKQEKAMPSLVNPQQGEQPLVPPLSGIIKQGMYDMSKFSGYSSTAELTTPNTAALLIAIDYNCNLKHIIKLKDVNDIIKIGGIAEGDIGVMVGNGEVFISNFK